MNMPITFEQIEGAYNALIDQLETAFDCQQTLNVDEVIKQEHWAELCSNPDFKPGRSNMEQDSKLRAAHPDFMAQYDQSVKNLEQAKHNVEIARLNIGYLHAVLDLGKILAAVKEEAE